MDFFDLILSFLFTSLRFVMIAYIGSLILGNRRKIGIYLLSGYFIFQLTNTIYGLYINGDIVLFLMLLFTSVLPILIGLYAFIKLTGGFTRFSKKQKTLKLKKVHSVLYPKSYIKRITAITLSISILVLIILIVDILLQLELMNLISQIIFGTISGLIIIFVIYQTYTNMNIEYDRILLYVGKNKEKCYMLDLNDYIRPISITDVYHNEDYIIDEMGKITVNQGMKVIEKNYIYWIATSANIEIHEEGFDQITKPFGDFIDDVSKYQKINLKLKLENGKYYE